MGDGVVRVIRAGESSGCGGVRVVAFSGTTVTSDLELRIGWDGCAHGREWWWLITLWGNNATMYYGEVMERIANGRYGEGKEQD